MKQLIEAFSFCEWLKIITGAILCAPALWLVMASIIIIGG